MLRRRRDESNVSRSSGRSYASKPKMNYLDVSSPEYYSKSALGDMSYGNSTMCSGKSRSKSWNDAVSNLSDTYYSNDRSSSTNGSFSNKANKYLEDYSTYQDDEPVPMASSTINSSRSFGYDPHYDESLGSRSTRSLSKCSNYDPYNESLDSSSASYDPHYTSSTSTRSLPKSANCLISPELTFEYEMNRLGIPYFPVPKLRAVSTSDLAPTNRARGCSYSPNQLSMQKRSNVEIHMYQDSEEDIIIRSRRQMRKQMNYY